MKKFPNFKSTLVIGTLSVGLLSGLWTSSAALAAETSGYTNYVTDSMEIPVRRGAGYKFKIQQMLKSGTAVKILKVDDEGWVNIEYTKGGETRTGWMPSSVLQNQPVAETRLQEQISKTNKVEEQYLAMKQELDTLTERHKTASEELSSIKQDNFEKNKELTHLKSVSRNAIALDEENQKIKLRLAELENQNAIMREQIDESDDVIKRQWFMTGAGVLVLGLLLGRFFRMPSKKRRWGDF